MAATLLHFGTDNCQRLLVLRSAGYQVEVCESLPEFRTSLERNADANAVLIASLLSVERRRVVTLTRENSNAGLVLFGSYSGEREFDLVIPPLTDPEDWLQQIADLIQRTRVLNASAIAIREKSALLRKDAEIARLKSVIERERSAAARARAKRVIDRIPEGSDPSDK